MAREPPQQPYPLMNPSQPLPGYAPFPGQPPSQLRRQPWLIVALVAGVALIVLSLLVLVGLPLAATIAPPTSWVYGSTDQAVFISWAEHDSAISGTFDETAYSTSETPTVQSASLGFTGIHDGSKITFVFSALGTNVTYTGTLAWRSLTLQYPDSRTGALVSITLAPGSETDYNNAVATIQQNHPGP